MVEPPRRTRWRRGAEEIRNARSARGVRKLRASEVVSYVAGYQGETNQFRQNLAGRFGVTVRTVQSLLPALERANLLEGSAAAGSAHVREYRLTQLAQDYLNHPDGRDFGIARLDEHFARKLRERGGERAT